MGGGCYYTRTIVSSCCVEPGVDDESVLFVDLLENHSVCWWCTGSTRLSLHTTHTRA